MSGNNFKRQKIMNGGTSSGNIKPTTYDTPKESLINFPSSVMNGITKEGGMVSLTFKSITCSNLVDNLDWMHSLFVAEEDEYSPLSVIAEPIDCKQLLDEVKNDVEKLETRNSTHKQDKVTTLHDELEDVLEKKESLKDIEHKFKQALKSDENDRRLKVSTGETHLIRRNVPLGVKITKKDDTQQ
ncbi:Piso0_005290 [Millerozyma farinosa CBS 7064]|uniref:Piso0_005290 protein n=1 Tax=Pichia sorbitophila (strain ATCC MYA-4447 / BCRC 22081 / CBS 7064 / NBRC 10061 / NRRL Y-12695) TaxID=559304 RepID=G8Y4Q2_PICSO|nr:Piso0_005290 [Millerozyma farinosa CBS 7064]